MKKGDIVKLKPGKSLRASELYGRLPQGFKEQELYTVSQDGKFQTVGCGGEVEEVMPLEEVGSAYGFEARFFDVVLPAGEPDVNKLMEESVMAIAE